MSLIFLKSLPLSHPKPPAPTYAHMASAVALAPMASTTLVTSATAPETTLATPAS